MADAAYTILTRPSAKRQATSSSVTRSSPHAGTTGFDQYRVVPGDTELQLAVFVGGPLGGNVVEMTPNAIECRLEND